MHISFICPLSSGYSFSKTTTVLLQFCQLSAWSQRSDSRCQNMLSSRIPIASFVGHYVQWIRSSFMWNSAVILQSVAMLVTLDLAEPDFFHSTTAYISSTAAFLLSLARYMLTMEERTPTMYFLSGSRQECIVPAWQWLISSTVAALILFLLKTNQNIRIYINHIYLLHVEDDLVLVDVSHSHQSYIHWAFS